MSANDQNSGDTLSYIPWAPIFWFWLIVNIIIVFPHLPAKKYLEKLSSIYDLNLFRLNVLQDPNPGDTLYNHRIHRLYYSPYSFYNLKDSELPSCASDSSFSLLHNNIRSLKRNLENFQVHLLDELNFEFSIIGVSETKIISGKEMDFNRSIPRYVFEYVPTPLASHIDNFIV